MGAEWKVDGGTRKIGPVPAPCPIVDHVMTPYLVVHEQEPDGSGGCVDTTAIFLTAATCPIGCSMCDLHQFTIDGPTPAGSIPTQIRHVLERSPASGWVKLYNSGNFFDPRSIPPQDYREIAELCSGFDRVIVENHPRFGSQRLQAFQTFLDAPLEVAVGLESVQPRWLARMRKQMSRDQFDQYAERLRNSGVDLRVFLIVGVPGVSVDEAIRWTRLSLRHAIQAGARHVSLIPVRRGEGWNGATEPLPVLSLDDWLQFQASAIEDADGRAAVTIDLWDLQPEPTHNGPADGGLGSPVEIGSATSIKNGSATTVQNGSQSPVNDGVESIEPTPRMSTRDARLRELERVNLMQKVGQP